jgi:hypothetical protein
VPSLAAWQAGEFTQVIEQDIARSAVGRQAECLLIGLDRLARARPDITVGGTGIEAELGEQRLGPCARLCRRHVAHAAAG